MPSTSYSAPPVHITHHTDEAHRGVASQSWRALTRLPPGMLALIPVALAAVVYHSITSNYFWADDFYTMYRIRNTSPFELLLRPTGEHLLAVYYAVFLLYYRAFGMNPEPYFWGVLLTHLLNVFLLFLVIRRVTESARLACFGATLWGTAPALEGTLGWFSVYGHALVTTMLLPILYQLASAGPERPLQTRAVVLWIVLLLAASSTFGVGIGIGMVLPAVVFLVLPPSRQRTKIVVILIGFAIFLPLLYAGLHALFAVRRPGAYFQPSTLLRPLLAKSGVYFTLLTHLMGYGITQTVAGVVWPNPTYPSPAAWVIVALYAGLLFAAVRQAPPRTRRWILACMVLAFGCYGIIAAGRAPLFNPERPSYRAARYQYVAPTLLVIALCAALPSLQKWIRLPSWAKNALLVGWLVVAAAMYEKFGVTIYHHGESRRETERVLSTIDFHINRTPPEQDVYIPNQPFYAMGPVFVRHMTMFPGWAGVFVVFYPDNIVDGRRVFFVEPQRPVVALARNGRRSATLLVSPEVAKSAAVPPS